MPCISCILFFNRPEPTIAIQEVSDEDQPDSSYNTPRKESHRRIHKDKESRSHRRRKEKEEMPRSDRSRKSDKSQKSDEESGSGSDKSARSDRRKKSVSSDSSSRSDSGSESDGTPRSDRKKKPEEHTQVSVNLFQFIKSLSLSPSHPITSHHISQAIEVEPPPLGGRGTQVNNVYACITRDFQTIL